MYDTKLFRANARRDAFLAFLAMHGIQRAPMWRTDWRTVPDGPAGHINGLPRSGGRLVATNGVLCYLEQGDSTLFLGHLDWFVKDPRPVGPRPTKKPRTVRQDVWEQLRAICGLS